MIDEKKEKLKTKENEKVEEKQEDKEKAKPKKILLLWRKKNKASERERQYS